MEFGQILASVYDAGVWLTGADCCSSGWREVGRFPGERWRHRWDVSEIGLFMSFFIVIVIVKAKYWEILPLASSCKWTACFDCRRVHHFA